MKIFLEILVSIILHPVALVLAWINIFGRADLTSGKKAVWALVVFFVPVIGPIIYLLAGDGTLW